MELRNELDIKTYVSLNKEEAEVELNRLVQIAIPNATIIYEVDRGSNPRPLNDEEVKELIKLPYDLCVLCLMKAGGFNKQQAEFLIKTYASRNDSHTDT